MQLSEVYSASCGLKIKQPRVYDQYFPFVEEKFITIDTENANYNYWSDVTTLILPYLQDKGIKIFELGNNKSPIVANTNRTNGVLSTGQKAFLLRKSELHIGSPNSFSSNFFATLDKKLICIVEKESRALPLSWGKMENHNFIYPEGKKFIEPERIAKNILNNLEIDFKFNYETIFIGDKYKDGANYIESFPDAPVPLKQFNLQNILVRMDLNFSEDVLVKQLQIGKASIYTNKPINLGVLSNFKEQITEIIYEVKEDNDPEFYGKIKSLGIPCNLISFLSEEKINSHKLKYMEMGNILPQKPCSFKDLPSYDTLNPENLFYRSKRFIFKNGNPYLSEESLKNDIKSSSSFEIQKVINNNNFWKGADAICILKKIN
jgi:hypothetical protein